ncbi:MAG: type II toxin-antitoxin system antitoxin SocA domain-containing protein [Candidatus Aquilonibacter sp.]|jgi:uncharacterized phage-associated protein
MTALDVAAYILAMLGRMTAMKLQKLVYYTQAWSLAWTGEPLYPNRVEAWEKGPVIRDLYVAHRGEFEVQSVPGGDAANVGPEARAIVDAVLATYGAKSPQTLSDLSHSEEPWLQARAGTPPGSPSNAEISLRSMRAYYGWLAHKNL